MCNCENYKKKYEELLEIEKAHKEENGRLREENGRLREENGRLREENGRLRAKIKELEANDIDLMSVYINGVYDERQRWVKKIKMNKEYFSEELLKRLLTNMEE